jgi:hypothetical protein
MVQQGGAYQYVVPQPIIYQAPMVQQPTIYQSPVPQGPPTFVVDTSPQAMQNGGFMESYEQARQGRPVMGSFGASSRHKTPRGRAVSPKKVSFGDDGPVSPMTKITVSKLG